MLWPPVLIFGNDFVCNYAMVFPLDLRKLRARSVPIDLCLRFSLLKCIWYKFTCNVSNSRGPKRYEVS